MNSYQKKSNISRSGQLLVEMLVALGILTVGFLAVTALVSRALALSRVVGDNYTATYLAAEGVEIAKNILDGNQLQHKGWNEGFGSNQSYEADFKDTALHLQTTPRPLLFDPDSKEYGYEFGNPTAFTRTIHITPAGTNEIIVNSTVDWVSRGGGTFNVDLEDHFFNWR